MCVANRVCGQPRLDKRPRPGSVGGGATRLDTGRPGRSALLADNRERHRAPTLGTGGDPVTSEQPAVRPRAEPNLGCAGRRSLAGEPSVQIAQV